MALSADVKVFNALVGLNASSQQEWEAENPILIENALYLDTTNNILKLGDGVKTWTETDVFYNPAVLNAAAVATITWVADIEARDAITDDRRLGLVMVIDASGDSSVADPTKKTAAYTWNPTGGESSTGAWTKIMEAESMDVDLSGYFNKATDTADAISDGVTKVMMTAEERVALAAATEAINEIQNDEDIVRYTHTVYVKGVNAAGVKAMHETV